MSLEAFNKAHALFTVRMRQVAEWRHSYRGAAYSTRLQQAITEARIACEEMDRALVADERFLRSKTGEHV